MSGLSQAKSRPVVAAQQASLPGAGGEVDAPWLWPLAGALALGLFLYIYSPSFAPLSHYWERAEYGHGYVMPFIAILFA